MDEEYGRIRVSVIKETKKKTDTLVRTDSLEKLKAKRTEFEQVFEDTHQFKEMYKYTFSYAKNRDQKCMEIEVGSEKRER